MSKKVSIDVPDDQQEQVLQFLEMLKIGDDKGKKKGKKQSKDDVESEDEFLPSDPKYVVTKVVSHKIDKDGKYVFEIKFKGYPDSEWIEDDLTDCEDLIQKYKSIPTVYAFCRVSSAGQIGEDHVSLDAQCDKLKEIAAEKYPGLRLKTFKISASAYKKIPQVLKSIGEAATRGSHIIVYRIDRLSRNIFQSMQWLENLSYKNVGVHSFVGGKSYAKKLERVDGGRLKIVDDENANSVIKWIKKSKLSLKSIANTLNKNGKKKRGHYWTIKMVNKYKK